MKRPHHFIFYNWLISLTFIFASCSTAPSSEQVLSKAQQQVADNLTIQYHSVSLWDNRFNLSTYSDTIHLSFSKLSDKPHKYSFYAKRKDSESIFDGINYREIDHEDQLITKYDADEIAQDSHYFQYVRFFLSSPFDILEKDQFSEIRDSLIDNQYYWVFKETEVVKKDSTRTLQYDTEFFIESEQGLLNQTRKTALTNGDTTQIINHFFTDFEFSDEPLNFDFPENAPIWNYAEVNEDDLDQERLEKLIAVGTRLTKADYETITDKKISLFGQEDRESLILFSFIGCGGCEMALRALKKEDFKIKEGLDLYYSSPQDTPEALKIYLKKKEFPFQAFAKESQMNEEFSVYLFPTFVWLNAKGEVTRIDQGYDEKVIADILN